MNHEYRNLALAALIILGLVAPWRAMAGALNVTGSTASPAVKFVTTDEFNGPFPSWRDVKRDYGAKGDGAADDSDAINKALADLRQANRTFNVLYFPAGIYRITRTITDSPCKTHFEGTGIAVIGADPATTIIKWDGPEKGTVFSYTAWYSRISRLTIDGAGKASLALLYNGEKFSTYNETSDMILKNSDVGLQLGGEGGDQGQAENMVLRCRFLNCGFGVRTMNFNSLDIWVWDSLFQDCGSALRNVAGNLNAYSCLFLRSKTCDIDSENLGSFSFVNNVSIGSAMFLDFSWAPAGVYGRAPTTISGNRVYDWTGDKGAIRMGGGPTLLWGNSFRNRIGDRQPPVTLGGDQGLFANSYVVAPPNVVAQQLPPDDVKFSPRTLEGGESIISRAGMPDPLLVLPNFPLHVARRVYDLPPGSDSAQIQAAIDSAAALKVGQRPIVHLPRGRYNIERTLVVPAGSDIQIIGDGADAEATALIWAGEKGAFVIRFEGPSTSLIRDIYVSNPTGNGIAFENWDVPGRRFYADRLKSQPSIAGVGVQVDGMHRSNVQFRCLCFDGSMRINGDKHTDQDRPLTGVTSAFCVTPSESNNSVFEIGDGASAVVRTLYYDAGRVVGEISANGSGNLLLDCALCRATTSAEVPAVDFKNFTGTALITTGLFADDHGANIGLRTKLEGDCSRASVLLLGNDFSGAKPHNLSDLLVNASVPPCENAGIFASIMENPSMPFLQSISHPDDVAVLGPTNSEHPGDDILHALNAVVNAAQPHTPGIGDDERPRIHNVWVGVGDGTGVLISGAPH